VCRPSEGRAARVVKLELAITVVDGGCARAAAVGEEIAMQWRSLTQCSDGGGASRRWLRPSLVIGIRVVGGETGGSGEPRTECPGPHLSFICAVRRGPASYGWAGRPRSGRESRSKEAVGPPRSGDQPNILPLDLNIYFNL
jgi:hypothetical protein